MKLYASTLLALFSLLSCSNENSLPASKSEDTLQDSGVDTCCSQKSIEKKKQMVPSFELVDVSAINPNIYFDLKYTTSSNFTKQVLYKQINRPYLVKDVALKLNNCQQYLEKIHPGYHLLIYDAVRPLIVQERMWNALDTIPVAERIKFVSNPRNGSVHNYGAAVDITIADEKGNALDMGAGFDDPRWIAYPIYEQRFIESGELSIGQVENRKLLRKVMHSEGFRNLPTEWWHFNAYSREVVKTKYKLIRYEEEIGIQAN